MTPSRAKVRRSVGWLSLATISALVPKCVLCFGAYAGLGAWLGLKLSGREICSAPTQPPIDPGPALAVLFALGAAWTFRENIISAATGMAKSFDASCATKDRARLSK